VFKKAPVEAQQSLPVFGVSRPAKRTKRTSRSSG